MPSTVLKWITKVCRPDDGYNDWWWMRMRMGCTWVVRLVAKTSSSIVTTRLKKTVLSHWDISYTIKQVCTLCRNNIVSNLKIITWDSVILLDHIQMKTDNFYFFDLIPNLTSKSNLYDRTIYQLGIIIISAIFVKRDWCTTVWRVQYNIL